MNKKKQTDTTAEHKSTITVSGIIQASASIFNVLFIEEKILLFIWVIGFGIVVASRTGVPNFYSIFTAYLRFFSLYFVMLFMSTRILFGIYEKWKSPSTKPGKSLKYILSGDSTNFVPGKFEYIYNGSPNSFYLSSNIIGTDLTFIRCVIMFFCNLALYSNLKIRYPFLVDITKGDHFFANLDNLLLGSQFVPSIEEWFRTNPSVMEYFTSMYMHDYVWFVALVAILYFRKDTFALRWLFGAVCITYMVSIIVTAIYPSAGPCFLEPERFQWLKGTSIGNSQQSLAAFYIHSKKAIMIGEGLKSVPFVGIAAFPSLHVGHMIVLLVIGLKRVPLFSAWMFWVTIATFLATIGFGWHYAVDGFAGVLIAGGITEGLYHTMKRSAEKSYHANEATIL